MWYLYLDESGDLGFDFVNKKPSRYFTITILAISEKENNRALINSIKRTIKRKLKRKVSGEDMSVELKGSKTAFKIKKYFYEQCKGLKFGLQAVDLFSWGIFRKYERKDREWYDVFEKDKIIYDSEFLPQKK